MFGRTMSCVRLRRGFETTIEAVSKSQIAVKDKAQPDEKTQHTWEYVSILNRAATLYLAVRWGFETASNQWG